MNFRERPERGTRVFAAVTVLALASLAAALVTQYRFNMQPCPWCVLQRLVCVVIAGLGLIGLVWRAAPGRWLAGAGLLAAGVAGMAAALWQHFVAAASQSCAQTLADRIVGATGLDRALPEVFAAYASCADAKAWLLGVPYEFYSLALFALVTVLALRVLRLRR